jgi:hypothetical protein
MAGDEIFLADCRHFVLTAPGEDEKSSAHNIAKSADMDNTSGDSGGGGRCFIDTAANSLR